MDVFSNVPDKTIILSASRTTQQCLKQDKIRRHNNTPKTNRSYSSIRSLTSQVDTKLAVFGQTELKTYTGAIVNEYLLFDQREYLPNTSKYFRLLMKHMRIHVLSVVVHVVSSATRQLVASFTDTRS